MMMVSGIIVDLCLKARKLCVANRRMALRTQRITLGLESEPVRVVTIAAPDASGIPAALQEGSVDIDLILDLAIGVVQRLVEQ